MKIQTMGSIEEEQRPLIEEGLISQSKHLVVFTGAGISTSCGIPDFRGPKGIWTLQKASLPFHRAMPSMTHMALVELERAGILKFVISQGLQFKWLFSLFLPSVIQVT